MFILNWCWFAFFPIERLDNSYNTKSIGKIYSIYCRVHLHIMHPIKYNAIQNDISKTFIFEIWSFEIDFLFSLLISMPFTMPQIRRIFRIQLRMEWIWMKVKMSCKMQHYTTLYNNSKGMRCIFSWNIN